jgi:dTDP-4-amino-4,6-dideoxygalactose transaminase
MNQAITIPFLDLVTPHQELEAELIEVFKRTIRSACFVGGPEVEEFEREFAQFCNSEFCIAVNSGTDALRFAIIAAGVQKDSIVITVSHTFIATAEAISQAGALPVFVDIDPRTYNMDPERLREYLETECTVDETTGDCIHISSGRTVAAIIPVHLYGQMADMDALLEIAELYKLLVIEDACQAHGAEYFSKKQNRWFLAGSLGCAAAFSFYPGKNLGACGEAGAVTTNDREMAIKISMLRDHGQSKKYHHNVEGYNGRIDSLQAGLLRVKLRHLPQWNERRRNCAHLYDEILSPTGESIAIPYQSSSTRSSYHLYVIRTPFRDELQKHLWEAGVGTGIHYPIPVHLQQAYASLGGKKGDFPESERAAEEVLSLPMFSGLQQVQQERVAELVTEFASVLVTQVK